MKYYFWILGCAMNYSDAERISAVLDSLGYTRTYHEDEANLFFVISCSVRQSAINRIYGKVKDLKERKDHGQKLTTILAGCVLEGDKRKLTKVFDIMFDIKELEDLPEIIRHHFNFTSIASEPLGSHDYDDMQYFKITPKYESTFRAYVPISTGCDNFCSYCAVPYTKGREKSRPLSEVLAEVEGLVSSGFQEITLLGQNVNSYGQSKDGNRTDNSPFIKLLQSLDKIPGGHRIYFYSNHPKDMTDELINTLSKLEHFPHYIHLPLQSGNNQILQNMNRHNTKEEYLDLVARIRTAMPDVNLTTDIIVGYPGETKEQFADTVSVAKNAAYDMAFIAQYSPRKGTVSAKYPDDVTKEEKACREKILQEIVAKSALNHNQKLIGSDQEIIIDEIKGSKYYGRTSGYKVVEIKTGQPLKIGQFANVKIESATSWKLTATL